MNHYEVKLVQPNGEEISIMKVGTDATTVGFDAKLDDEQLQLTVYPAYPNKA